MAIFSFIVHAPKGKRLLHHHFVSKLLNDLFGIQSRSGCSCAGIYPIYLLGIEDEYMDVFKEKILEEKRIFKPGYTRINFHFFISMKEIDYILDAIEFISNYGWLMLPHYKFELE